MIIWGIFWGIVLGALWPGPDSGIWAIGAILGAAAGWSLRRAVRTAIAKAHAEAAAKEAAAPSAAALPGVVPAAAPVTTTAADAPTWMPGQARHDVQGSGTAPAGATEAAAPPATPDGTPVVPAVAATPATNVAAAAAAQTRIVATAAATSTTMTASAAATPTPITATAATTQTPTPSRRVPAPPPPPSPFDIAVARARAWLFGGNTVARMGVLVLFVGLAFLAKYAVDNALLPPELRLAAIAGAGIALFVGGLRVRRRSGREGFAMTLQGAGIAVLYLAVFAAFRLWHLLPPGAAFVGLALICAFSAVIAWTQNALPLAFIGFAGGYAAPLLVSTGSGDHVGLFTYYLLLGVAIAGLAWKKAWRPLNLLGFFATFGVATLWGTLRYRPEHLASTEPFLIAFFVVFLAASLFYALRHGQSARRAVDGTLVFGVPLVALTLQAALVRGIEFALAFSSLALGALYLALGLWLMRRKAEGEPERVAQLAEVHRWLAECFLALGLGFVTLAVPLALDARWTAAVWAVEGAGVLWLGVRQDRWKARAAGMALQVLAAMTFLQRAGPATGWPFAQPVFLGGVLLAASAFLVAWWSRPGAAPGGRTGPAGFAAFEESLTPIWFWVGFLWAQYALASEITRHVAGPEGTTEALFAPGVQVLLRMFAWVGLAFALHHLALPQRKEPWPVAATPAWTTLPAMLFCALWGLVLAGSAFQGWGWVLWPLAIALHVVMLRRFDAGPPAAWWPGVHAGGVWLLVLLGGQVLVHAIGQANLWQTAWASVTLLVAGSAVLLVLARRAWWEGTTARWPLDRFAPSYLWIAAAPLAVTLAVGALLVAVLSDGNARPLPYAPLLNPTDLAVAFALATCGLWLVRVRGSTLALVPPAVRGPVPIGLLAALAFIGLNTVWLRVAHHYAGVPWNAGSLFGSFLVQAGYSILWTLVALALMVVAHRRAQRSPWMLGAGLLGLTVLKLFVIDLSNRGGSERIVVFIAVGLLMLVVGWIAPLPPSERSAPATPPEPKAPAEAEADLQEAKA